MKQLREGKTTKGKELNIKQLMALGAALTEHANTMKREGSKTKMLIEIQNRLTELNTMETEQQQRVIANACVEQGNLIHKLERLQEETRRTTEELKRKQYALHEKADDAVCTSISNLAHHRKMAKLSEDAAQSSIEAQDRAVEELSTEIEVQRKANQKVTKKFKVEGEQCTKLIQSQANALQQVISEREEAITEKDGLVKKVQAIEEERVLEKQMGELVEQELSEKKKLEDELHRKNDIIKTFVNQEFKQSTGPNVCTTALNSSIYSLWFNDDQEDVEG